MSHRTRIMFIEHKGHDGVVGPARIGRVTFSKTGQSVWYRGRILHTMKGRGFKSNYVDEETREEYWISGCRKDGMDALYSTAVEVDDDAREEYWVSIRNRPELKEVRSFRARGKY
ncbi:MAG TPA: hypothetical protein VEQ42_00040 [Pyrinomonadaceae bacterium]|nr:hypothetical protein [Pyrinomonadaceae bacterium]